jgi:protein TonB
MKEAGAVPEIARTWAMAVAASIAGHAGTFAIVATGEFGGTSPIPAMVEVSLIVEPSAIAEERPGMPSVAPVHADPTYPAARATVTLPGVPDGPAPDPDLESHPESPSREAMESTPAPPRPETETPTATATADHPPPVPRPRPPLPARHAAVAASGVGSGPTPSRATTAMEGSPPIAAAHEAAASPSPTAGSGISERAAFPDASHSVPEARTADGSSAGANRPASDAPTEQRQLAALGTATTDPAPPPAMEATAPLVGNPAPTYPVMARRRGIEGRVVLRVTVSPAGIPDQIDVRESTGHPSLDQAAIRAVGKWRFQPATVTGRPVSGTVDIPIVFRLDG